MFFSRKYYYSKKYSGQILLSTTLYINSFNAIYNHLLRCSCSTKCSWIRTKITTRCAAHVPTLIGKFWKTLNPRNFQTNNIEKFSREPKDRVFQELSNDVSQVSKIVNLKIAKNGGKKVDRVQSPSPNSLGWNNKH